METPSCMHAGANAVAVRVPVHGGTASGGRHLSSPTGAAANGMPLYTLNPSARTPDIEPDVVTASAAAALQPSDGAMTASTTNSHWL